MDILLGLFLYVGTVVGSIIFIKSRVKKILSISINGIGSPMLGEGSNQKEKVKKFDKEPIKNPDTTNNVSNTNINPAGNVNLPNMSGVDNGNMRTPELGGFGGGVGLTAVVGVINGIGAILQNGKVSNRFQAKRQITGPIYQGSSMIYNTKFKGIKALDQSGSNITNTINRGRLAMNQSAPSTSAISQGKVNITPRGRLNNYVYGDVKKIKSGQENIYTKSLQIKGISKAQTLFVKQFVAQKGTRFRMQQLASGNVSQNKLASGNVNRNQLTSGNVSHNQLIQNNQLSQRTVIGDQKNPNVSVVINNINFSRPRTANALGSRNYSIENPNEKLSMLIRKDIYGDPKNSNLSSSQKQELYIITRMQQNGKILTAGGRRPEEESNVKYKKDLSRTVVEIAPHLNKQQKIQVVNRAMELKEARKRDQQSYAMERTRQQVNEKSKTALDDLLRDTSAVSTHFNNYISENFDDVHHLSEEEMREIEEQARENVKAREDLSLEEKETEYERIKEELTTNRLESRLEEIEKIVKEEILDNPDEAKEILGEEGVKSLQEKLAKIQGERDEIYQKMLRMQKKSKISSWDEYKKRRDEEMKADINTAINELYPGQGDANAQSQVVVPFVSRQAQKNELERKEIV